MGPAQYQRSLRPSKKPPAVKQRWSTRIAKSQHRTIKPSTFWCPIQQTFKRGPRTISYDKAIGHLPKGRPVIRNDPSSLIFNGNCWRLPGYEENITISEGRTVFLEREQQESPSASLARRNPAAAQALFRILHNRAVIHQEHGGGIKRLRQWRYDMMSIQGGPCQVGVLVEWEGGEESWETETMLQSSYPEDGLSFWEELGGRHKYISSRQFKMPDALLTYQRRNREH